MSKLLSDERSLLRYYSETECISREGSVYLAVTGDARSLERYGKRSVIQAEILPGPGLAGAFHCAPGSSPAHTASATAVGGRSGSIKSSDGVLDLKLAYPRSWAAPEARQKTRSNSSRPTPPVLRTHC
jgi:hypothetical protein